MPKSAAPPKTLRIAVLILPPVQLLDLSPIDLFHMLSKQYLTECNLPAPFIALGLDTVDIHYVSEHTSPPSNSGSIVLAEMTANAAVRVTDSLDGKAVQPGAVDVLMVPGPDPSLKPSEAAKRFIREHVEKGTAVISVCTGIIPLGHAGVLDGRTCTGPRALLGGLKKDFPRAKWTDMRWAVDCVQEGKGELWTAGGITNGQDMVAAYIRDKFKRELADLVCGMADVGWREQKYENSGAAEGMWWGFLLFRSWVGGLFGDAKKRERVEK